MNIENIKPVIIFGSTDKDRYEAAINVKEGRVKVLSAIEFCEKIIDAIKDDKVKDFRSSIRDLDVLVIRDIETLAGKERTQIEVLETFRSLYFAGKQIVVTAYEDPAKIDGLFPPLLSFLKGACSLKASKN